MQDRPFIGYFSSPGFCALFQGDLHFLAGGRRLARDLKLCLRFGGSEPQARATLLSSNLGQEVPVPKALKHEFLLLPPGRSCWPSESTVAKVVELLIITRPLPSSTVIL